MTEKLFALQELAFRAFPKALARYSPYLLIGRPILEPESTTLARIDLRSRSLHLGALGIMEASLESALEALIAHEIGHHVAYPGSPTQAARLLLLEKTFLPRLPRSLTGPFYDLLIDERLVEAGAQAGLPSLEPELCRILRVRAKGAESDHLFTFQRAVLEEVWQRPEGDLIGAAEDSFHRAFPHYRVHAQLVAQNLFALAPDITLQYLYFASIAFSYAMASDKPKQDGDGHGHDCIGGEEGIPAEAWAEALLPKKAEKDAIKRAVKEGWFSQAMAGDLENQSLEERVGGMPGVNGGTSVLLTEVMAAHYRREAEKYLFQPPPIGIMQDALVPTTLDEWEPGDPVTNIDWVSTLLRRGETLGAAAPLIREKIADEEGQEQPSWEGRTEIYLDVSGSMPDPKKALNAMTLAAQILVAGTIRAGGSARALMYSVEFEKSWTYCRSEKILSRFLMNYIGGGTSFPFEVLEESVEECRTEWPVRVIITDADFDMNYESSPNNAKIFARAAARSSPLVLLLHQPRQDVIRRYEVAGARVIAVRALSDFPRMAAALAFSLFEAEKQQSHVIP